MWAAMFQQAGTKTKAQEETQGDTVKSEEEMSVDQEETTTNYETPNEKGSRVETQTESAPKEKEVEMSPAPSIPPPTSAVIVPKQPISTPTPPTKAKTPIPTIQIPPPKAKISTPTGKLALWTDKHTPRSLREVVGNLSLISKVVTWVSNWSPADRYKAVLISGPPGIGKTTTMRLIGVKLGFSVQELNASDLRSKEAVERRLKDASDNRGISGFKQCAKSLVIMDEIDGMSGGDKGGVAALIDIIKRTKIPIICICNDRSSPKLKSLVKSCLDIRFFKPTSTEIAKRLKQIAGLEGFAVAEPILELIAKASGLDLRQSVNMLQLHARGSSWSAALASQKTNA